VTNSCPDCGSAVEYADRNVRLRTGNCEQCGHPVTIVEEAFTSLPRTTSPVPGADKPEPTGSEEEPGAGSPSSIGVNCRECGAQLTLRSASATKLEAACPDCDTTLTFVLAGTPSAESEERPRFTRERGSREGPSGPSRSRPCRECGGTLKFTTGEDGMVTGECTSCGNRFVLPPREDRGRGRGPRTAWGRPGGSFRPRFRSGGDGPRGRDSGGAPRYRSNSSRPRGGYSRDDDGDDSEGFRRRRRPSRE